VNKAVDEVLAEPEHKILGLGLFAAPHGMKNILR
jgi:hypothetical protein